MTYDAAGAVTPAAVAQSVNTEDVASRGDHATGGDPADDHHDGDSADHARRADQPDAADVRGRPASVICTVDQRPAAAGRHAEPDRDALGDADHARQLRVHGAAVSTAPAPSDEQTLTMQVNPAVPVASTRCWNGLDTNWYNPANWSPRGVPAATSRVYISAATPVVPRLTANVTVRDLFLEPGATLDTNGFTLTVTNNADAGHTIIGPGTTVLTGNGGTASGVFSNLEIRGRITLSAPLTTTGTLTLDRGRAARAERSAADRRRTADHQRHAKGRCRSLSAPRTTSSS